ncbi:uncharacterized protein MELLADRAFT_69924 [Melampsora larici-populina 98AG31]|uniref:Uncharacterized protein n=1 Tax=Melampsora larici-populina (strain 98AG31 / pathotype 3-4-7) TaxID=747676 RepID=F4SCT9_MELLP|nr:uncharacterized protein MELLADRAFT_69924 [Melampsora larici-populina 98AG31]EGF97537.1 hypothetical protein MELLADRAFT_69924 [Melampsora larici-populina 98AG31]
MWEGIERASTLLSIKKYIKTYTTNPKLDYLAHLIPYFINLGTPFGKEEVSTILEHLFLYIEQLMDGSGTHMQKRISFHLLLHMERHDGLSRVEIRSFVQRNEAYAETFRRLYIDLLHKKVPELDTVVWTLNAKKELKVQQVYAILQSLCSPNLLLTDKGNLFRVLNLTCVMYPNVREIVNRYLNEHHESTTLIFQMLRIFYTNLEPKNENPKDLKDDIEEKGKSKDIF